MSSPPMQAAENGFHPNMSLVDDTRLTRIDQQLARIDKDDFGG